MVEWTWIMKLRPHICYSERKTRHQRNQMTIHDLVIHAREQMEQGKLIEPKTLYNLCFHEISERKRGGELCGSWLTFVLSYWKDRSTAVRSSP
jgi:hypothetical protein